MTPNHKRRWGIVALLLLLLVPVGIWLAREPPAQKEEAKVEDVDVGADPVMKQEPGMMRLEQSRRLIIDTTTKKATALRNLASNKYHLRYELWRNEKRLYHSKAVRPGGAITDYKVALKKGSHEVDVRAVVVNPETKEDMNTMTIPVTLIIQ
ncbi:hypothetical protein [Lacticaseibacillus kribbianus]|uniref:hypothetical protein n=1 Tax=Lacticaseibacillus kribbianus TaxID=2926292 RepID=UPI001CD53FFB|nr:hypothetical protein [Lacticaseibacillus kribbianus]